MFAGDSRHNRPRRASSALCVVVILLTMSPLPALASTYVSDSLGRLVTVVFNDNTKASYAYDSAGNLLGVTHAAADSKPDSFAFTPLSGVARSSVQQSNAVTVSGIDTPTLIAVTNGQYCISSPSGCGCDVLAYTTTPSMIINGQRACVRHTSAATGGTAMVTTLSIGAGANLVSAAFQTTTATAGPNPPQAVNAVNNNGQIVVTFAAPNNGGSPITGYTVISAPAGGVDSQAGTTATSHTITGVALGTQYRFSVTATNAIGTSAPSSPSLPVIPSTPPGAPTGVIAAAFNGGADIAFVPPVNSGGQPITGYTVTATPAAGSDANANSTDTMHTVTGLTNGVAYTFTVRAKNAVGTGPPSSASNSVKPAASAAIGLTPTALPAGSVGAAYNVTLAGTGGVAPYSFTASSLPPGMTLSAAGVLAGSPTEGGSYNFTIAAADNSPSGTGGPFAGHRFYALTIAKANSTVSVAASQNPSATGASVLLTATVSGTNGIPNGEVNFVDGGRSFLCIGMPIAAGKATCNVQGLVSGSHAITATYGGNATYNGAVSAPLVQVVTGPDTSTPVCSLIATPATVVAGGASLLSASCSPAATSYAWTGGTCVGNTSATCSVTAAVTTTYTVKGTNAVGTGAAASATVTVTSAQVIEFYNTILDNYFITADAAEAKAIDNGSAGPGWIRTGNTFASGGTTPVCRFYGSQSPGPNSHFYTADADECEGLKHLQATTPSTQKRWNFEGLDFLTTPAIDGNCPAGLLPVYRAYNNGSTRGVDSNHRITTNPAALKEVVDRGWEDEGLVMCATSGTTAGNQATVEYNLFCSVMPVLESPVPADQYIVAVVRTE